MCKKQLTKRRSFRIISHARWYDFYGGIAQLVEHPVHTRPVICSNQITATNKGPLVKRLRHRPFTAVTWVRFPYGSPKKDTPSGVSFFWHLRESNMKIRITSGDPGAPVQTLVRSSVFGKAEDANDSRTGHQKKDTPSGVSFFWHPRESNMKIRITSGDPGAPVQTLVRSSVFGKAEDANDSRTGHQNCRTR